MWQTCCLGNISPPKVQVRQHVAASSHVNFCGGSCDWGLPQVWLTLGVDGVQAASAVA